MVQFQIRCKSRSMHASMYLKVANVSLSGRLIGSKWIIQRIHASKTYFWWVKGIFSVHNQVQYSQVIRRAHLWKFTTNKKLSSKCFSGKSLNVIELLPAPLKLACNCSILNNEVPDGGSFCYGQTSPAISTGSRQPSKAFAL